MKNILTIAALLLSVAVAYGQRPGNNHQPGPQPPAQHQPAPQPGRQPHNGSRVENHGMSRHEKEMLQHNHGGMRHDEPRSEVFCNRDWQELWNGRHVRLISGRVYIYTRSGDKLLWGDDVILMPSGDYRVRQGDYWRVYERDGDRTMISGHEILPLPNGCYNVRLNDVWRIYDPRGNKLNIWSREYIELLPNGYYRYGMNDYQYVADERGDRVFNIWGERVDLMENGLFRCRRNGYTRYYDARGNERR